MENAQNLERSKSTDPPLLSKKQEENVKQANRELGEPANVLEKRKQIDVKVFEVSERQTPNLMLGSEEEKTALDSTDSNSRPEFKEQETDNQQKAASEDWVKKAWGKIAFSSPDNLYFKPNIIEKWGNGRIYEMLGVRSYRKLFKHPPSAVFAQDMAQDRKIALKKAEENTRIIELIDLAGATGAELFAAYSFYSVSPILGYVITAANFAFYFYPIIFERYSRVRLHNLIDKLNARERKNNK